MRKSRALGVVVMSSVLGVTSAWAEPSGSAPAKPAAPAAKPASAPADSTPAAEPLKVGDKLPRGLKLSDSAGKPVALDEAIAGGKPVVLVFYRGGWCPFCNKNLAAWQSKLGELEKSGASIIAVAMEKPIDSAATSEKDKLSYRVLSDESGAACRAAGLIFQLDDKTRKMYEGYGINLAKTNANGKWELPHPATFVIDKDGVVRYARVDKDYRQRADPDEVIAAVRKLGA